jgi:phage tail sheath protein FI
MATYRHGVYVSEQDTSLTTPIEGTAGLQVIFGTAPVNMVADPYKAANIPQICYSFAEAVAAVGYSDDFENYTLCQSIDACFRVFNVAPIILVNVLDPNNEAHKEQVESKTATVKNQKATLEKGVLLDTITVNTLTKNEDFTTAFDNEGNAVVVLLNTSKTKSLTSITASYSKLKPSAVTANDIIGTVNSITGEVSGLECINKVYPMFGLTPGLISAPGWTSNANVVAALEAKCTGINGCFTSECLIDIGSDDTSAKGATPTAALKYSDVKTAKENLGIDSAHSIACWPYAVIGKKKYCMSALVSALIAYNDAANGDVPYLYPSNKSLGITGLVLKDGTKVILDQEQANLVNSYGVVTALNHNGYKCWGNNTAVYPSSTDPKDRWIAVRRMFTWWGNTLILTYHQRVDDPANYRLIENIIDSENIRGNSFVARGIVAEARCEFLAAENPVTNIMNGEITFHIHLTPFTPAEDIEFILEFNPYALETALTGGDE